MECRCGYSKHSAELAANTHLAARRSDDFHIDVDVPRAEVGDADTPSANTQRRLISFRCSVFFWSAYAAKSAVLMGSARSEMEKALRNAELLRELKYIEQRFARERCISDLEHRSQMAKRELEWARREAEFMREAEALRREEHERAAANRMHFRSRSDTVPTDAGER